MGRRRRRGREPGYVWWAGFAVLLLVAALATSWRLALIAVAAWCLYQFSLNPTICRLRTREGHVCDRPVRGRLFACSSDHQGLKNDALWEATGARNPFGRRAHSDTTDVVVYSPPVRATLAQDELIILGLAALGTLGSVIGMVVGLLV